MYTIEQKKARHLRFWEPLTKGEGAYISINSPIDDSGVLPGRFEPAVSKEQNLLDVDYAVQKVEAFHKNTYFGLDALHCHFINFGPGVQAAFFGAPYIITKESVWFDTNPPIKSWEPMPDLKMNRDHALFKAIEAQTRALCAASNGRYVVSHTDIGGQYDILFSLRGEEMLMDLLEYPEEILAAEAKLDDAFIEYFNFLTDIIKPNNIGYTGWMPVAHNKPWYPIQCDASVMISPKQFEKFVLPSLDKVSTAVGETIYHLDGPGQIRHLNMLLSLKHVHAIQWVPLPTLPKPDGYFDQNFIDEMSIDFYRRVLAAGKKVVLYGIVPNQIQKLFDIMGSSDGFFIQTYTPTRKAADEMVAHAEKTWVRL